jgi:serine protease DegQ
MEEPAFSPSPAETPVLPSENVDAPASPDEASPSVPERRRLLGTAGCLTLVLALAIALFAGLFAGVAGTRWALGELGGPVRQVTVLGDTTTEPAAAAAAAALPSVVNIDVSGAETRTAGESGLPQGHPNVPFSGQASGVAYRAAPGGATYILTNDHVVEGASSILVTSADGTRLKGTLVGRDPETDMAVVTVPGTIPVPTLGDSDKLIVGQLIVAIGSPFGLQHSVSSGVVSGLHRSLPDDYGDGNQGIYPLVDVIQTDAAINPGNSGGALVDRAGKLVGINTAIYSDTGANAGIGFAIPISTATRIADELIASGKARHPFLGILGQTVDETLAANEKLPVTEGAMVVEVTKGTGAEKAGLKTGDVIVALDGKPIRSMDELILAVRRTKVGQSVKLTLYRDAKRLDVTMAIGDKPAL